MALLSVGDKAPAFATKDQDGKTVKLSDFKGQKVVLYFYPKDDTPGCTKEACSFRDAWAQLKRRKVAVLGVSVDDEKSHRKFADKFSLPFTLLADTDKVDREVLRHLGREEHVRPQVHGHEPRDVPDRREGQDRGRLAQGQARGPRRGDPGRRRRETRRDAPRARPRNDPRRGGARSGRRPRRLPHPRSRARARRLRDGGRDRSTRTPWARSTAASSATSPTPRWESPMRRRSARARASRRSS